MPACRTSPCSTDRISAGARRNSRRNAEWIVAISAPAPTAVEIVGGVATVVMATLLGLGRAGRAVGGLPGVADTWLPARSPGAPVLGPNGHTAASSGQPPDGWLSPATGTIRRQLREPANASAGVFAPIWRRMGGQL